MLEDCEKRLKLTEDGNEVDRVNGEVGGEDPTYEPEKKEKPAWCSFSGP
jgi:hypothetical protein